MKPGFIRTINWYKYQTKVTIKAPNPLLDYLIDPRFQGVNMRHVLSFENTTDRTTHTKYYLPTADIKDYIFMIDGQSFFNKLVKNNLRTYDDSQKISAGQGDDYMTSYLLHYYYFNKYYKTIVIALNKQQALDADLIATPKINFTGNLDRHVNANTTIFFIIVEVKETKFNFLKKTTLI